MSSEDGAVVVRSIGADMCCAQPSCLAFAVLFVNNAQHSSTAQRTGSCNAQRGQRTFDAQRSRNAQWPWKGIKVASKGWTNLTEQMVEGLLSMQPPEDRMGEWQRAWDEMDNGHMEGEGEPVNTYAVLQLKQPDA